MATRIFSQKDSTFLFKALLFYTLPPHVHELHSIHIIIFLIIQQHVNNSNVNYRFTNKKNKLWILLFTSDLCVQFLRARYQQHVEWKKYSKTIYRYACVDSDTEFFLRKINDWVKQNKNTLPSIKNYWTLYITCIYDINEIQHCKKQKYTSNARQNTPDK